MEQIMTFIGGYLGGHPEFAIFLCLGLGFLAGNIRIGSFRLGATVGTLLVSLVVGQFTAFSISDQVKSTFFLMFSFVLGYESGPAFFSNLRSSGLKSVLLSLFYSVVVFVVGFGVCKVMGYDAGTAAGLMGGAQTQSSILGSVKGSSESSAAATVAYALTYIFGTVGVIMFVKKIGPVLLKADLAKAVKAKVDAQGGRKPDESAACASAVQMRAYRIGAGSGYVGKTVASVEDAHAGVQVEKIFRGGAEVALAEDVVLNADDIVAVVGRVSVINAFDDDGLTETTEEQYLQVCLSTVELIVTEEDAAGAHAMLDRGGILINRMVRNGRSVPAGKQADIRKGDRLTITGPAQAVRSAVKQLGYIRDTGDAADVPFFSIAIAVGIILGSFYINFSNVPLSLGASGGALLLGLVSGWINDKHPRRCYLSGGARWFLRSVGLNVFIAVTALNAGAALGAAIGWHCIPMLLAGAVVTLVPHIVTLLFAHHVMKMDPVDILGALCGAGTCTAALNTLSEETNSSAFAAGYSPAYAVGNITLTVVGILVATLL